MGSWDYDLISNDHSWDSHCLYKKAKNKPAFLLKALDSALEETGNTAFYERESFVGLMYIILFEEKESNLFTIDSLLIEEAIGVIKQLSSPEALSSWRDKNDRLKNLNESLTKLKTYSKTNKVKTLLKI